MERFEKNRRTPFTKGWSEALQTTDSLPIKRGSRVIPTYVQTPNALKNQHEEIIHDDEEDGKEAANDQLNQTVRKLPKKKESFAVDTTAVTSEQQKMQFQQTVADICTVILANPEESFRHRKKAQNKDQETAEDEDDDVYDSEEEEEKQSKKKKAQKKHEKKTEEEDYHIEDLLKLAMSKNYYEVEIALLSTALLFKDVCPSYRIRHVNSEPTDNSQQNNAENKQGNPLKKETKKLMQFEKLLVKYYHDFLMLLQKRIEWAFQLNHSLPEDIKEASLPVQHKYQKIRAYLGFIAYKCQCEMIKSLYGFNYRSVLVNSILTHAVTLYDYSSKQQIQQQSSTIAQKSNSNTEIISEIMNLCVETIEYLLTTDKDKDCVLEILAVFNRLLKSIKYNISIYLLKAFHLLSFHIHMNEKEKISKQKKMKKKQLKHQLDSINKEVQLGLLESNANGNDINKKSFELQILQEICLVYFR
jgi:hypothetical protein